MTPDEAPMSADFESLAKAAREFDQRMAKGQAMTSQVYPMTFSGALQAVLGGKKITRREWDDNEYYGILRDGILQLHKPDGFHSWIVSEGDLRGDDWLDFD